MYGGSAYTVSTSIFFLLKLLELKMVVALKKCNSTYQSSTAYLKVSRYAPD